MSDDNILRIIDLMRDRHGVYMDKKQAANFAIDQFFRSGSQLRILPILPVGPIKMYKLTEDNHRKIKELCSAHGVSASIVLYNITLTIRMALEHGERLSGGA